MKPPAPPTETISPLDRHFAELMLRLNGPAVPELKQAAIRASAVLAQGHVCLPLDHLGEAVVQRLGECRVVGGPGAFTPLVLDAGRLYLRRYFDYESDLARMLLARSSAPAPAHDDALLADGLDRFFPNTTPQEPQRLAAARAVQRSLSIVTGGPGTGKTRTAAIALALLAEQFVAAGKPARFALAAPTGKAATRLAESLSQTLRELPCSEEVRAALPTTASTLHRLLGHVPGSADFQHDAKNPLAANVIVVDEASMIALPMMARLFAAIAPEARLVLLGDKDQLASVEAGHVLGDLCAVGDASSHAIRECITTLTKNHRFRDGSDIHQLSQSANAGDAEAALALLQQRAHTPGGDLTSTNLPAPAAMLAALKTPVLAGFHAYLEAPSPAAALEQFGTFRILCALREGPYGVAKVNHLAEELLADASLIAPDTTFYHGRPVIVTRNDYQLRLFNGDIGITLRDPEANHELRVFFPEENGGVRSLLPGRLPEHDTAFAMTVHKSQGSEFDRVLLVLPSEEVPVLTRELIYTGLTRARTRVEVWWREASLRPALARRVERWSGLRERLGK